MGLHTLPGDTLPRLDLALSSAAPVEHNSIALEIAPESGRDPQRRSCWHAAGSATASPPIESHLLIKNRQKRVQNAPKHGEELHFGHENVANSGVNSHLVGPVQCWRADRRQRGARTRPQAASQRSSPLNSTCFLHITSQSLISSSAFNFIIFHPFS